MLTSKATLLVGGWLALTAALVGTSGIAGETTSNVLLLLGAMVALALSRGPSSASGDKTPLGERSPVGDKETR